MKNAQIAELLDRYWEGETSLDEERQLKAYFASGDVDERFQEASLLFKAIGQSQKVNAPAMPAMNVQSAPLRVIGVSYMKRYMAAAVLTGLIATGAWFLTRTTPTNPEIVNHTPAQLTPVSPDAPVKVNAPPTQDKAIAAVAKTNKKRVHKAVLASRKEETYTDAEAQNALEKIKAALTLVSKKMKQGKHDASKSLKKVEIMDQYIIKPQEG
jgi:hypothetical protein